MRLTLILFILFGITQSCFAVDTPTSAAAPISHDIWDNLLKKHVSATGFVNYGGLKKDQAELKKYLELLSTNAPATSWTKEEKLAYWINAYNAFTVQLILNHADKGLKSIKDIGDKIKIPFVNTAWDIKFIKIGGKELDLNNIEHGIIRKQFDEPRIHFALVCAAKSCPSLRNEAFVSSKLNAQLHDQGVKFFNDNFKNDIKPTSVQVSKILDWYGSDFDKSIIEVVNTYSKTKANKTAKIVFKEYNWELNGKL